MCIKCNLCVCECKCSTPYIIHTCTRPIARYDCANMRLGMTAHGGCVGRECWLNKVYSWLSAGVGVFARREPNRSRRMLKTVFTHVLGALRVQFGMRRRCQWLRQMAASCRGQTDARLTVRWIIHCVTINAFKCLRRVGGCNVKLHFRHPPPTTRKPPTPGHALCINWQRCARR